MYANENKQRFPASSGGDWTRPYESSSKFAMLFALPPARLETGLLGKTNPIMPAPCGRRGTPGDGRWLGLARFLAVCDR